MGRLRELALFMFLFLIFSGNVLAESCNYEQKAKLNNEVANVKVNYEILQKELDPSLYGPPDAIIGTEEEANWVPTTDYFQINVLNLTENFYIEMKNEVTGETTTYTYANTDNGKLTIEYEDKSQVTKFSIVVKSSDVTGCAGESFKTLYLTLPRYNDYSEYSLCDGVEDYYMCQRYVTFDEVEFEYFVGKVNKEIEKKETKEIEEKLKWYEKAGNFIVKQKVAFITGGVIVVAGGAITTVVIIRKRRRSII